MDLANEILNNGLRSKCYELIEPTDPLPVKPRTFKKTLPAQLTQPQRKTNKIAFNYKHQNFKQKRKKFF